VELLLTMEPDNIALDNERIGLIQELWGDNALLEEFERRFQQDPTDSEVLWQLISAYSDQSRHDEVIKMADAYIAQNPDDIDVRLQKINAYRTTNRIDETIAVLKEIAQLRPQDKRYLIDIAESYRIDKQNLREALNWASRARRLDRNYGPANYLIAELIVEYTENIMSKFDRSIPSYDDKMIYEIAVSYFKDAVRDLNTRSDAQRYVSFYEENYMRTSEDKFMNKGYDTPRTPDYNWIWRYKR
jgi:tetratricopeptide (TPR) repeat protein